jgi:ATP-dependent Lhr-like helicase
VEFSLQWQHVACRRQGEGALESTLAQLQGLPLLFSELESEVLKARVEGYARHELDELLSRGELLWRGVEALGAKNGRIAFYPAASYALLAPPRGELRSALADRVLVLLTQRGASFFADLQRETKAFGPELTKAIWELVWSGHISNDTLAPLRGLALEREPSRRRGQLRQKARGRVDPSTQGRWSILPGPDTAASVAECRAAWVQVLLARHGVLSREALRIESIVGGFSAYYPVLAMLEERGRVRRGYFARGLSGQQFATLAAADTLRQAGRSRGAYLLSATDPANPYGGLLAWPEVEPRPQRTKGAWVILQGGRLLAYVGRGARQVQSFAHDSQTTARLIDEGFCQGRGMVVHIETIDGLPARSTRLGRALAARGFHATERGHLRKTPFAG